VAQPTEAVRPTGSLYCSLEGRVDRPSVWELRRTLRGDAAATVIVDLSHVEFLDDATLVFLMMNLIAIARLQRKAMALRGLRDRQIRLLNHLGVEFGQDGSIESRGQRRGA
jgi:anti-anti-sigma regulatory factor